MNLKRFLGVKILAGQDTDRIMNGVGTSWLRSLTYKVGSQFLVDRDFPLHLYLELSRACNFNCPMCMAHKAGSSGHFPVELARKVTSEAAKKGPTSYSLHLFGEPLANPEWDKIVEIVRAAHPNNTILLTTNGYFMNESCCLRLIELGVNRIFVSIHSLDPELYRKNTGGGYINVVLNNVKTFAKVAPVSCNTKLFVRLFVGPDEPPCDDRQLAELRGLGVGFEVRSYHNFCGGRNEWTSYRSQVRRWPCFHPWFTIGVAVDGKATICCADYSLGLCVGNAYEQSIEEIWKSDLVKSIRKEHIEGKFGKWKVCGPCDTWRFHPDIFFDFQKRSEKLP